jgi:hypothetical protein
VLDAFAIDRADIVAALAWLTALAVLSVHAGAAYALIALATIVMVFKRSPSAVARIAGGLLLLVLLSQQFGTPVGASVAGLLYITFAPLLQVLDPVDTSEPR